MHVNKLTLVNNRYDINYSQKLLGTYYKFSTDKNATLQTLADYEPIEGTEFIDEIPFSSENKRSLVQLKIKNEELKIIFGGLDVLIDKIDPNYFERTNKLYAENKLEVYRNLLLGFVTNDIAFEEFERMQLI